MFLLELLCVFILAQGIRAGSLAEDTIPGEPQLVTVESTSSTSAKVSWFPPADRSLRIRGYKLGYGKNVPEENERILSAHTLESELTNLEPGVTYAIVVMAYNNRGDGLPVYKVLQQEGGEGSPGTNGGEGVIDGGLVAPIMSADEYSSDSVSLSWTGIKGATDGRNYNLRYRPRPPSMWQDVDTSDTTYTVSGLEPNTLYQFEVKVITAENESPYSIAVSQRTEDGPPTNTTQPPNEGLTPRCEDVAVALCSPALIPYNITILPNLYGHTSQDQINLEIQKWFPVAVTGCSIMIGLLVCSTYVPACTVLGFPIPPCKEVCTSVQNDCQDVMDFPWPEVLNCDNFPSQADSESICIGPDVEIPPGVLAPPGFTGGSGTNNGGDQFSQFGPDGVPEHCEPLEIEMCQSPEIPYNYTQYPAPYGDRELPNQESAMYEFIFLEGIIESGCSPVMRFFACAALAPVCSPLPSPIPPCRELCEIPREQCKSFLETSGTIWPAALECENFPEGPPGPTNPCIGFTSEDSRSNTTEPDLEPGPGSEECNTALGIQNGDINDKQMTASSFYSDQGGLEAWDGRLNNTDYWATSEEPPVEGEPWIQVDLLEEHTVTGIIIQGSSSSHPQNEWVTELQVQYGDSEDTLTFISENNETKTFEANTDKDTPVTINFPEPIVTRTLRIKPTAWNKWCSLRFEILGCPPVCVGKPAGLEDGSISDEQLKASSEYGGAEGRGAHTARVNSDNFWATANSNLNIYHWLQIDFVNATTIKGIRTQGALPAVNQWVTALEIETGDDEDLLLPIQANGSVVTFKANTDSTGIVDIEFPEPLTTRILRVVPTEWDGWVAMRLEVIVQVCEPVVIKAGEGESEDTTANTIVSYKTGWPIEDRQNVDSSGWTMVAPDLQFTSEGQITEWNYWPKTTNPFRAIVWRPQVDAPGFDIVGINDIPAPENTSSLVAYTVPEDERITVQAGDMIGWSFGNAVIAWNQGGNYSVFWIGGNLHESLDVNQTHQFTNRMSEPREYSIQAVVESLEVRSADCENTMEDWKCEESAAYCDADGEIGADVRAACPKTCNACPGSDSDCENTMEDWKCEESAVFCDDEDFGADIRAACPKTCNACSEFADGERDRKPGGDGESLVFKPPVIEEGTPMCQDFAKGVRELCPGLEYNSTFFPNSLGHSDQEEAYEALNQMLSIMSQDCSGWQFLCVLVFPPCKEFGENKAVPLLPCRGECNYATSACVDVDFDEVMQSLSKWTDTLDCEVFPEEYSSPPLCWEITNAFLRDEPKPDAGTGDGDKDRKGEGEDTDKDRKEEDKEGVCSTDIPKVCSAIGFKSTLYPNKLDHQDGMEALQAYEELQPAFDSMCSPELSAFVCAGLFPVCDSTGSVALPCHESCRRVWKACKDTFSSLNIDRPLVLSCNKYYEPVETDPSCLSSFNMPTKAPKLKNIDRQATTAKLVLWPEDENAKYFDTKVFAVKGPEREIEKKFNVSADTKTTSVTYEDLKPNVTYYANIKTANAFGESPSILETIPKFEGVECQSLEIEMCRGLGYDMALKDGTPNSLGHIDQAEAFEQLLLFNPLIQFACSDQLQKFLCWRFVPGCSPDHNVVIPPCRESCEASRFGCETPMKAFGYEWPADLDCEQFPYSNESICELNDNIRYTGTQGSEGSDYLCTKVFNSDPETPVKWYDSNGEEIGEDPEEVIYTEKWTDRMTRLVITENSVEVAGDYTCRFEDAELKAQIKFHGFVKDLDINDNIIVPQFLNIIDHEADQPKIPEDTCNSNDHPFCGNLYNSFRLPNHANQTDPREAILSTYVFLPLMATKCSEYINHFACYYYLPNSQCMTGEEVNGTFERFEWGFGTTDYPCRELCYKVQQDCAPIMEEIGFIWPEEVSCDSLPEATGLECDHFGVSASDLLVSGNYSKSDNDTDIDVDGENATDIYPTEIVTEFCTLEADGNYTCTNDTDAVGVCTGLKPRRYDIEDLGSDCLFRGWADVQAQGAANDYCRVVKQSGPQFLSCALAGDVDDHVYTSPNASIDWFDAGHSDTWYMKDEDGDGRDDYCRCVGAPPDTIISCMKADENGFIGFDDFQIEDSTECQYNKVNPFFGAP